LKRILLIGSLIIVFIFVEIINWTCLILDFLFYPSFRRVNPKPPVFIIGMPRSATTLCYTLLSADSQTFSAMKLWEILLAPSVIQKQLALKIYKIDTLLNRPLYKCISRFDRYFFRKMEEIHHISLFSYEEDEFLFLHVLSTVSCGFLFPKSKRILSLKQFDESLKEPAKRFLMRFYMNCVKRHLFVFGPEKRYLAKSASYSPKIMTLLKFFPGSQFVYMLRDPLYAIASTASLFRKINEIFNAGMDTENITNQVLSIADAWYRYPLETCKSLHGKSVFILPYSSLTTNPRKAVHNVYSQLGQNISPDFLKFLNWKEQALKRYISKNQYSPEEFGLMEQSIKERYDFVYRNYEFDTVYSFFIKNKIKELSKSNLISDINSN
jgi:omega-hydroxy-beta-dihydromenaquinone-9 sulfotransferase